MATLNEASSGYGEAFILCVDCGGVEIAHHTTVQSERFSTDRWIYPVDYSFKVKGRQAFDNIVLLSFSLSHLLIHKYFCLDQSLNRDLLNLMPQANVYGINLSNISYVPLIVF